MSVEERKRRLAIAVLIGSVLSILGAMYMILCFTLIKSLRSFRHQLILGLAVADLALAINFFIPTLSQLRGPILARSMPNHPIFCYINGFLTQLFFSQIDLWQLVIAISTLLLLSGHSPTLKWAREHMYVVWVLPWAVSIATAFLAFGIWSYASIGPFCWLPSTHIRLYYNYLPRWIVIITCLAIYIRIFLIIRKARKIAMIQRASDNCRKKVHPSSFLARINMEEKDMMNSASTSGATSMDVPRLDTALAEAMSGGMDNECEAEEEAIEEQERQIRRIAFQLISFPLAYAVLWTIPTVVMIYEVASGNVGQMSTEVECMAKLLLVFNGFVDAHIYSFNERTTMGWKQRLTTATGWRQRVRDAENPVDRRQARDSYLHEVVS